MPLTQTLDQLVRQEVNLNDIPKEEMSEVLALMVNGASFCNKASLIIGRNVTGWFALELGRCPKLLWSETNDLILEGA